MIIEIFFNLILCTTCTKQCTFEPNQINKAETISLEQLKVQKRPTILSFINKDFDISGQNEQHLKSLSEIFPQVNFAEVDCSGNIEICSKFDSKYEYPFHTLYLPDQDNCLNNSIFTSDEHIETHIKSLLSQHEIYPLQNTSNIFIFSPENKLFEQDDISIFILYESKCAEDVAFINDWLKAANKELLNVKIGFLDCSKYSRKCSQLVNNDDLSLPVALARTKQTPKFTKLKTFSELSQKEKLHLLRLQKIDSPILIEDLDIWPEYEDGQCGEKVDYAFNRDTGFLLIYGTGEMFIYENELEVPWYKFRNYIKSITFKDGVTLITNESFSNCNKLTSISISSTVKTIYAGAFRNCSNLESVICNSNLTVIKDEVFANCSNLSYFLYLGTNNPYDPGKNNKVFYGCDKLKYISVIFKFPRKEFLNIQVKENFGLGSLKDNLNYFLNIEKGIVNVTGEGQMLGYENPLYFPWTEYSKYITIVDIGDGVTSIGLNAFKNFKNLTDLILPSSLTKIENFAFNGCSSLATINFPNSLNSIGDGAFSFCSSLTTVEIKRDLQNIGDGAFANCIGLEEINVNIYNENYTSINGVLHSKDETIIICFPPAKNDSTFRIQDNIMIIENFAFSNCYNLTKIIWGNSIKKLGNYSFSNTSLTHIYIPESVTNISHYAFSYCSSLETVIVSKNVEYIGSYAFGYTSINSFSFLGMKEPEKGYNIFEHCTFKEIYVLKDFPSDKNLFFSKSCCKCLTEGTCGYNSKYIYNSYNKSLYIYGYGIMYDYDQNNKNPWYSLSNTITKVIVMDEVYYIGSRAFIDCTHLTTVIINENVKKIGSEAFCNCHDLQSIKLPIKLSSIGTGAFARCDNLESITIPSKIETISGNPFGGCIKLKSVTFESNNKNFVFVDDILYPKDFTTILYFPYWKNLTSFEIPNNVTKIDLYTFYKCEKLESVSIPSNVRYLDTYAFGYCINLMHINFPTGLSRINDHAFYGCSSLERIEIPEGMDYIGLKAFGRCTKLSSFIVNSVRIETIESSVFEYCNALEYVAVRLVFRSSTFSDKPVRKMFDYGTCGDEMSWYINISLESLRIYGHGKMNNYNTTSLPPWNAYSIYFNSILIEEDVETIGDFAFINCSNVTIINIPKAVTTIGKGAFYGNSLYELNVDENNENFKSIEGILFSKNEKELICYPSNYSSTTYFVSNNIDIILDYAFMGSSKLESITFDGNLTSICNYAFYNCIKLNSLTYMGINEPTISNSTFEGCLKLKKVLTKIIYESNNFGQLVANKCFINGQYNNNIQWIINFEYNNLTISGSGNLPNYSLTTFPPWDSYKSSISLIIIEDGINYIGSYSFAGCINLTRINIPKSVSSISNEAFIFCDSLDEFSVDSNNTNFSSVNGILFSKDEKILISYPVHQATQTCTIPDSIESINSYAFSNCINIETLIIRQNITDIDEFSFINCSNLNTLYYLGINEPSIHLNAFEGCTNLIAVRVQLTYQKEAFGNFPIIQDFISGKLGYYSYYVYNDTEKSLSILGDRSVEGFSDSLQVPWINYVKLISKIVISDTITYIGEYVFTECCNISSIYIPRSVYGFGGNVFPNSLKFENIELDENNTDLKIIDGALFSANGKTLYCYPPGKTNTSFVIPNTVSTIERLAFFNCIHLNTIIMNDGVKYIDEHAFGNCTNLNTFIFMGLKSPSLYIPIFDGCINLTKVLVNMRYVSFEFEKIPVERCFDQGEHGTNIKYDFRIKNQTGILILSGNGEIDRKSIPWNSYSSKINQVIIQNNITSIPSDLFNYYSHLNSIDVDENNMYYKSINGVLYNYNESIVIKYPSEKPESSFMLSDKVMLIPEYAFKECYNLITLSINSNLTEIANYAFYYCSNLSSIFYYGQSRILTQYPGVFSGCFKLQNIFVLVSYPGDFISNIRVNKSLLGPPTFESSLAESEISEEEIITGSIETSSEIEPLPFVTPTPKPEISETLRVPENTNDSDLDKLLNEKFEIMANQTDKNKIVIIDSSKITFNTNLDKDQFIKPKENSEINYNGGNLNIILPNTGKVLISFANEEANLSINGEGELTLAQQNHKSNSINIKSNSQINGSLKITVPQDVDTLTLESIELKNNGSIVIQNEDEQKSVSFNVNDISVTYNTNATISDVTVLNSINLIQTSTMNLNNVTLVKALINIEIFDLKTQNNVWKPLFKGNFNNAPSKVILKKTASENPAKKEEYTLATGMFENDICESWISNLEYGNSGFNWKKCENNQFLEMENKRIVIKSVDETSDDNKNDSKLSGGQIAGIVIGVIAGVAIIVVAVLFIIKKKNKNERSESQDRNDDANEL